MDDLLRRTEEAVTYAVKRGAPGHVCHRRHDAGFPGNDQAALHDGDQLRRTAHRSDRYCRPRHAGRRQALVRFVIEEVVKPSGRRDPDQLART